MSGCHLQVPQSFDQAEVLMLFYETFGGSITRAGSGLGLCKPAPRWTVCGQSARNAAELLAPRSITKRKQLFLAAQWPDARSRREDCKAELRALKEYDSAVAGLCSWEYCAGFFDAEGHIRQQRGGASLELQIKQKHPRVLECLREFLSPKLRQRCHTCEGGRIRTRAVGLRSDFLQADTPAPFGRWSAAQSRASKAGFGFDDGDCGPSPR